MHPTIEVALKYVREELGHQDATHVASILRVSSEDLVLVRTQEAGIFAVMLVNDEVVDDCVTKEEFARAFKWLR